MSIVGKLLKAVLGFILGAATTIAAGAALLLLMSWIFDVRLQPRGAGWIIGPIVVGVMGWRVGYNYDVKHASSAMRELLDSSSRQFRIFIACSTLWMIAVVAVFLVFDPFGRYSWNSEEWTKFLTILFGPAVLWFVGQYLFAWANKNDTIGKRREDT